MVIPGRISTSAYADWIVRTRWRAPVILVCVLLALAAGYGLRDLQFSADYRVFFGPENPELKAYEAFEEVYSNTDSILFVLQPGDRNVFTEKNLEAVKALTDLAWKIPHAIRVDSVTNFQHTKAEGDDLWVRDLVEAPGGLNDSALLEIRRAALEEPALRDRLIAADASTTGVLVALQFPGRDHTKHLPAAVTRAREMAADFRLALPDWRIGLTGVAIWSQAEMEVIGLDLKTLVPVMYAVMIGLMLVLLRSFAGTVATLLVVTLAAATGVGLSAWLGMRMNVLTALAPVIILTLAVADSVHVLVTAFQEMREGRSKEEAFAESVRVNAEPVFLTSLTTSIGFLSLNFSDSPPFGALGNIAAMGVFAAWGFSMTLLPAFMSLLPLRVAPRRRRLRPPMERFGDFVVSRRRPLLWISGAAALLAIAFIPRIELDDRYIEWFDQGLDFRVDTDFATANLVGPYTLEFSIQSGEPGGIAEPAYLERLEAFASWLRAQPEVTHVNSFGDIMMRVNRSMHGDDPEWYRQPGERDLAAQYLLLYEMSLPYGLDLNSQVNIDKSATRLTATLDTVPQKQIFEIIERAERWLVENAPPAMRSQATGTIVMFVHVAQRNIRSMLGGTALAFLLIAATLVIALRNPRQGLISLIPNFVPVLITFGLWGAFVGQIGIIASIITATSMGLIVDDTVHILSKYSRARREHRLGTHDAVRFSFSHVGIALWMTTTILVAGFAVLTLSRFQLNSDTGLLTAITLSVALVMDFLLLPPLLMAFDKERECHCVTCVRERAPLPAE
jgi:predicted RND superfamily exporter protein